MMPTSMGRRVGYSLWLLPATAMAGPEERAVSMMLNNLHQGSLPRMALSGRRVALTVERFVRTNVPRISVISLVEQRYTTIPAPIEGRVLLGVSNSSRWSALG